MLSSLIGLSLAAIVRAQTTTVTELAASEVFDVAAYGMLELCPKIVGGEIDPNDAKAFSTGPFFPMESRNSDEIWAESAPFHGKMQIRTSVDRTRCTFHYFGSDSYLITSLAELIFSSEKAGFQLLVDDKREARTGKVYTRLRPGSGMTYDQFILVSSPDAQTTAVSFSIKNR